MMQHGSATMSDIHAERVPFSYGRDNEGGRGEGKARTMSCLSDRKPFNAMQAMLGFPLSDPPHAVKGVGKTDKGPLRKLI